MSSAPPSTPQEKNLLLIIKFTRTSPSFGRQKRIEALQKLVDRCTIEIQSNIATNEAALRRITTGNEHRDYLNAIRAVLPAVAHREFVQMTDQMWVYSREELDILGRTLGTLRICKREAEQGRECGPSPLE